MGETLSTVAKKKQTINTLYTFIYPYLSNEKIAMLQTINEDNVIDKEVFESFFLCTEREFSLFKKSNGLIDYFELITVIYLLKTDVYKTKVWNILNIFTFYETDVLFNKDTFTFITNTFINSVKRLYSIDEFDEDINVKLLKEIEIYERSIFRGDTLEDVKISYMRKFIEEDEALFNFLFIITEQTDEVFRTYQQHAQKH
jgi:hypothetical protein